MLTHAYQMSPKISNQQIQTLFVPLLWMKSNKLPFAIHANEAHGPDDHNAHFFHIFWKDIKNDIFKMVNDFFLNNILLENIGLTHIVLIPKSEKANS